MGAGRGGGGGFRSVGGQGRCERRSNFFVKIKNNGGRGGQVGVVGLGGQGGCERRIGVL